MRRKMKKILKISAIGLISILLTCTLTGCWLDWENIFSFENRFQTTEDGFVYYVNSSNRLYLIEVPDSEEITIPEYIDGYKVIQLGKHIGFFTSETKEVDGSHVKKITIQHYAIYHAVDFHNAEVCIILDYLYCEPYIYEKEIVKVRSITPCYYHRFNTLELRKSDREIDLTGITVKTIQIPEYVTVIEKGVFDGLTDVVIQTAYESKPDGWENGWNGNCIVEWGAEF